MTRILLAALGCIAVAACPAFATEIRVLDRKPVARGAEVVLELVTDDGPATYYQYSYSGRGGVQWPFYRMMVRLKRDDGSIRFEKKWIARRIDDVEFNERRVSLFHPDLYDCVVVTLDLDPAAPQVFVDRFRQSYGWGGTSAVLTGVDELELTDFSQRWLKIKKLTRDPDGTWQFAGIPHDESKMSSKVSTLPLPSIQELLQQDAKANAGQVGTPVPKMEPDSLFFWPDIEIQALIRRPDVFIVPPSLVKQERLRCIHDIMHPLKNRALAPALSGGPSLPLPSMTGMHQGYLGDLFSTGWWHPSWATNPWYPNPELSDEDWITVADLRLPCFTTDYDRAIKEVSAIYGFCGDYYNSRLAQSLQGVDSPGFLAIIEWELARAGK